MFLVVDTSETQHGHILNKYFRLSTRHRLLQTIFFKFYKRLKKKGKIRVLHQTGYDHPEKIISQLDDFTEYRGYFQSLQYFYQYQKDISALFAIKKGFVREFENKYRHLLIDRKSIVIHIRRTDYAEWGKNGLGGKNLCLPDNYIFDCISKIGDTSDYNLIFISDDIDYARDRFSLYFPAAGFIHDSEIIDFQFLLQADILILSNSTFAWWGPF